MIQSTTNTVISGINITLVLLSLCSIFVLAAPDGDTVTRGQLIRDGDTVVSDQGSFELGFFSPGRSKNSYVGIWYKKVPILTVVWVANRDVPLLDTSGTLNLTQEGVLVLLNGESTIIWSSNSSTSSNETFLKLLDSGNLVIAEAGHGDDPEKFLWQSFDYPTDTFLPGMKLGIDFETGLDNYMWSWKDRDDPGRGDFTYRMDGGGFPQYFLRRDGTVTFGSGPWNGLRFSGMPTISSNPIYNFTFVLNRKETYFLFELLNSSVVSRMVLNDDGVLRRMTWMEGSSSWAMHLTTEMTNCDMYAFCGAFGCCTAGNSPECQCLEGFSPASPRAWGMADWSNGCVRNTALACNSGDGFIKYSGVKVPDARNSSFNTAMTLQECRSVCLRNCSCTAYANTDVSAGGRGCLLWFGELVDIRVFSENGQDLYIRMAASDLAKIGNKEKKAKTITIIAVVLAAMLTVGLAIILCIWKKKKEGQAKKQGLSSHHPRLRRQGYYEESKNEDIELPLYDLDTISSATNSFATENLLGEGGFGPVYKGILEGGQEIAVKLLSKTSRQGVEEFKNEVICIARLQHRNLVKLLGCCIQEEERMLIYEYMPNNSLDCFIFDQTRNILLDWPKRFSVINGIARGLLYLHQDSRLRIIHRDLKASNILLDQEMNPKISDFGMARIFGANETQANTKRVVGTYGYMPPEYAIEGLFSMKSDVYSFGVLVLEIISGKRNRGFSHSDHHLNLLGHAWRLHNEGTDTELIDPSTKDSCNLAEALRSIHVGLLCVQQMPEDRPNMSTVVLMLAGEGALPQPKQPGFFNERSLLESDSSESRSEPCSTNMITITHLVGR